MHEIKQVPDSVKKTKLLKAFNYIHLQAFGEQLMEDIYWCKTDIDLIDPFKEIMKTPGEWVGITRKQLCLC